MQPHKGFISAPTIARLPNSFTSYFTFVNRKKSAKLRKQKSRRGRERGCKLRRPRRDKSTARKLRTSLNL